MKNLVCIILAYFVFGGATAVCAEGRNYIGLSYNNIDYDETGLSTVEPTALVFQVGHEFGPVFSIEGRLGGGSGDDTISGTAPVAKLSVLKLVGGYLKWQLPTQHINPYLLLGYTSVELEIESLGFSATWKDKGTSFGLGLDLKINPSLALNLEQIAYISGETVNGLEVDISSTNFGLKYFF